MRFLSLRWNVVTEAIFLQATLVFGLLRYARNDKNQDRRVVLKDSSPWQLVVKSPHYVRNDNPELVHHPELVR